MFFKPLPSSRDLKKKRKKKRRGKKRKIVYPGQNQGGKESDALSSTARPKWSTCLGIFKMFTDGQRSMLELLCNALVSERRIRTQIPAKFRKRKRKQVLKMKRKRKKGQKSRITIIIGIAQLSVAHPWSRDSPRT